MSCPASHKLQAPHAGVRRPGYEATVGRVSGGKEGLGIASGWLELLPKHVCQSGIVDLPHPVA